MAEAKKIDQLTFLDLYGRRGCKFLRGGELFGGGIFIEYARQCIVNRKTGSASLRKERTFGGNRSEDTEVYYDLEEEIDG